MYRSVAARRAAAYASSVPRNAVAPAITGTAQVGQTLTVTNGTWANSPTGYSRQWKRGAVNVGAGATTYVPVSGDIGSPISCVVTATNAVGSAAISSNSTANVIA